MLKASLRGSDVYSRNDCIKENKLNFPSHLFPHCPCVLLDAESTPSQKVF